jgi:hypothetical protein
MNHNIIFFKAPEHIFETERTTQGVTTNFSQIQISPKSESSVADTELGIVQENLNCTSTEPDKTSFDFNQDNLPYEIFHQSSDFTESIELENCR